MDKSDVVVVFAGTKWRKSVIMRVLGGERLLVLWGTGIEPLDSDRCVKVDPATRAGKAIGLEKTTYFTSRNIALVSIGKVREQPGRRCPPGVFLELEELIGQSASGTG